MKRPCPVCGRLIAGGFPFQAHWRMHLRRNRRPERRPIVAPSAREILENVSATGRAFVAPVRADWEGRERRMRVRRLKARGLVAGGVDRLEVTERGAVEIYRAERADRGRR